MIYTTDPITGERRINPSVDMLIQNQIAYYRQRGGPTADDLQRVAGYAGYIAQYSDGINRGKPVALLGVGARIDWARTQLWRAGFEAIDIEIVGSQWLKSPKGINVLSVEYRGVVVVRDAEAAQAAVRRGVGRGKAWGCGMLLLT